MLPLDERFANKLVQKAEHHTSLPTCIHALPLPTYQLPYCLPPATAPYNLESSSQSGMYNTCLGKSLDSYDP